MNYSYVVLNSLNQLKWMESNIAVTYKMGFLAYTWHLCYGLSAALQLFYGNLDGHS